MNRPTQISIPTLVRVKEGALDRVGLYLNRDQQRNVAVLVSKSLQSQVLDRVTASLKDHKINIAAWIEVADNQIEMAAQLLAEFPGNLNAVVGVGGGKALDLAKYVGFLSRLPYYSVPTSLSNDGICSPQSSLTIRGRRRSFPAAIPYGVIIDTAVCLNAPRILTLSGVGDLMAKFTAVRDWKLAFHETGEPVNDFAALLSDGSTHAFLSHPDFDLQGIQLLATSLLMNGMAMEICGSSRPASGSEHLISHALDAIAAEPRLHGLQVGVATYLVSLIQGSNTDVISAVFEATGFWRTIAENPFSCAEWITAIRAAPTIKMNYYTILSRAGAVQDAERFLHEDPRLVNCFRR